MKISVSDIEDVICSRLMVKQLKPAQKEVIIAQVYRKHVIATLATGYGKSLCYQALSAVSKRLTLVIEPYVALIQDQVIEANAKGLKVGSLYSDMPDADMRSLKSLADSRELRLLFVTPERLMSDDFLMFASGLDIGRIVIDEAHCLSSMGDGFRPAYGELHTRIAMLRGFIADRGRAPFQLTFLSATLTEAMRLGLIAKFNLNVHELVVVEQSCKRDNIAITMNNVHDGAKLRYVIDIVRKTGASGATLVYASDKGSCKIIAERLKLRGYDARMFHASLPSVERRATLEWFKKASGNSILVATSALSAGFNKSDIRTVIHFNPPRSIEDYSQEIGRAGRDGLSSDAYLLYCKSSDERLASALIRSSAPDVNRLTAFALWLSNQFDEGNVSIVTSLQRLRLEYGLAGIAAGEFKTLIKQCQASGILDYNELEQEFEISVFSKVDVATLVKMLSNHESLNARWIAMKQLIETDYCKHDFIASYLEGRPVAVKIVDCMCCHIPALDVLSISDGEARKLIMDLRASVSRIYRIPPFLLIPPSAVEHLVTVKPDTLKKVESTPGFDKRHIELLGQKIVKLFTRAA